MPDDVYTHGHDESVLRSHRWRTVDNSAPHLVDRLAPGLDVLDVGCGPGTITCDIAERVAPGRVVGIDRSDDVLAAARVEAERRTVDAVFEVGDVYALDAEDASYDVVHAHQVLQHLTDPVAALVEMRRVCRPGGLVAVRDADYGGFTWAPADERLSRWLGLYRMVARSNGAEPDAGRFLKRWMLDAGFAESDLDVGASAWCFSDPEDRAWWGGLWADRMLRSDLAAQSVDRRLGSADELDAIAAGFRSWADDPSGWFLVPHGEVIGRVERATVDS